MPSFVYGNTLRDRIGVERMRYTQSSDNMLQLVEFTQRYKRVRVEGCAGSGKTSLAAAKARQLSEEADRRILLLAYNREVVDYLGQFLKDCPSVTVSTFHAFCRERCLAAGIEWPMEGTTLTQSFWTENAPQMLDSALEKAPCVYDAILIDEAQDFQGEADAVILLDVDPADERWNSQGLYTAMTRARHLLAIVEKGKE